MASFPIMFISWELKYTGKPRTRDVVVKLIWYLSLSQSNCRDGDKAEDFAGSNWMEIILCSKLPISLFKRMIAELKNDLRSVLTENGWILLDNFKSAEEWNWVCILNNKIDNSVKKHGYKFCNY